MKMNEYQQLAQRTANTNTPSAKIENGLLGLFGEGGECADTLKKHRHQGHEFDRAHMIEELGDVLWYCAELACGLGVTLEEVAQRNIDKLRRRYPEGFDAEQEQGGVSMAHTDAKQRRLQELFADLRYLKQKELTHEYNDPVMQANHMIGLREQIAKIEERIEREMDGMRSSMIEQTAEEIALRVNADEGEQLITNEGIRCFTTWIDENGNLRCGIRGGENG